MNIFKIVSPFVYGFCIAFILNVLMKFFEEKFFMLFRFKRQLSLILSIIIVLCVIFILFLLIIPEIKNSIIILAKNLPEYMEDFNDFIIKNLNINWEEIAESITNFILPDTSSLIDTTINITSVIFNLIVDIILSIIFAVYLLLNKEKLVRQFKKFLSAFITPQKVDKIFYIGSVSNKIFSKFIIGQCIDAILLGISCYIGMLIFAFPYSAMISCVICITALVPMLGSIIGSMTGIILILLVNPFKALWFAVFIILLQQIDSTLIYPKIVGKRTGLPGIWVLFCVTVGGNIAGPAGMLISVPVCSVIYYLLREYINSPPMQVKSKQRHNT